MSGIKLLQNHGVTKFEARMSDIKGKENKKLHDTREKINRCKIQHAVEKK